MSFWSRVGVQINDLSCFKASCDQHDIEFEQCKDPDFKQAGYKVYAFLKDKSRGRRGYDGYLVEDGGGFKMIVDNDPNYSMITRRLGRNGGKLGRDYTKGVITKGVRKSGKMVDWAREQDDGSIVMKVSSLQL